MNQVDVGQTISWEIQTSDSSGTLTDADSTPTVEVRKNGAASAETATVTKRASTTGLYDVSFSPAGVSGDRYVLTDIATVDSTSYRSTRPREIVLSDNQNTRITKAYVHVKDSGLSSIVAVFYKADLVWNGSSFVTWNDGNVATYAVSTSEIGTSKRYGATKPSGATAVVFWQKAGANLDLSTDTFIGASGL